MRRRDFIARVGAVGAGIGTLRLARAEATRDNRTATAARTVPVPKGRYQRFQPGQYLDWERRMAEERLARVRDFTLPADGAERSIKVLEHELLQHARVWDPYNPLFTDRAHAQAAGYPDVPALPTFVNPSPGIGPLMVPADTGDTWYFANDGGEMEFFAPIHSGDALTMSTEQLEFEDRTVPGSDLRLYAFGGTAVARNERGEVVVRSRHRLRNAYRRIIDGSPRPSFAQNMEEWTAYFHPAHVTTDAEWDRVLELWKAEKVRGREPLYWDDVRVGDQPAPVCTGPVSYMDLIGWHPQSMDKRRMIRERPMDIERSQRLYRDRYGNYLFNTAMHYGTRNVPGARMVFYNNTAARHILRMVTNWCGDRGFVTKVAWMLKQLFTEMQDPALQGGEYLDRVPFMRGKTCTHHGSEGDTVIARGYVTRKYMDGERHFVDLTCWGETFDDKIIQVVPVTVQLPRRPA